MIKLLVLTIEFILMGILIWKESEEGVILTSCIALITIMIMIGRLIN